MGTVPRRRLARGRLGAILDVRSLSLYPLLMLKSSISSKGQVTVPVEIRERLGLATGTAVLFELRPDGVLLKKGMPGAHPVDRVFGLIKPAHPTDSLALLDHMRGPRPGGRRARRK
jgi:AbrB family looped-hinge helix DNA binding protein